MRKQLAVSLLAATLAACQSDSLLQPVPLAPPSRLVVSSALGATCPAPPTGLISWWKGDNTGLDAVGGNDATLLNGVAFGAGQINNAFLLDGLNDDASVGTKASLNIGVGTGYTLQAWVRPEGSGNTGNRGAGPILEWVNGVHVWNFNTGGGTTGLHVNLVELNGTQHLIALPTALTQLSWNHIAVSYTRTTGSAVVYVNGVQVQASTLPSFTSQTSTDLHIGNRPANSFGGSLAGAFKGRIDDVQIYNRVLTATEVQGLYNTGISGGCALSANAGAPAAGTEGTSVGFSGSAANSTGATTFDWDFGDGTAHGTGATPSHTYADNGTYAVTLTVTDAAGSATATTSATITNVAPVPTLTLQSVPPIHTGTQFTMRAGFSDKGTADGPWTYKFFRNTTLLQQGTRPTQPPPGATQAVTLTAGAVGTYTYRLEITDKDGTTGTQSLVVQVVP
ncbi:MAG: PKD domain-containing protein [Gemmatimonadaceae bacterium]